VRCSGCRRRRRSSDGVAALSIGLAAGIVGLIAVIRRHERSWLVWLAMLPGLMIVAFMLVDFLVPN
jgi:hypothetical protein